MISCKAWRHEKLWQVQEVGASSDWLEGRDREGAVCMWGGGVGVRMCARLGGCRGPEVAVGSRMTKTVAFEVGEVESR